MINEDRLLSRGWQLYLHIYPHRFALYFAGLRLIPREIHPIVTDFFLIVSRRRSWFRGGGGGVCVDGARVL